MARVVGVFRAAFVRSFLGHVDRAAAVAALPYAAALHGCDPNITETERAALADLVRSNVDG
jgi:hypothetical protein